MTSVQHHYTEQSSHRELRGQAVAPQVQDLSQSPSRSLPPHTAPTETCTPSFWKGSHSTDSSQHPPSRGHHNIVPSYVMCIENLLCEANSVQFEGCGLWRLSSG